MARQTLTHSAALTERAERVLPGPSLGTFLAPAGQPFVAARGAGEQDLRRRWQRLDRLRPRLRALILGHARSGDDRSGDRAGGGSARSSTRSTSQSSSWPSSIVAAAPCAEKVKFASTGSEATFLRDALARASPGATRCSSSRGGYHGHSDYARRRLCAPAAPARSPIRSRRPDSAGVPHGVADRECSSRRTTTPALAGALIEQHRRDLAAVIVEPLQRLIPPQPGFLEALRAAPGRARCAADLDEVVTGFRLAWGGAQERYGVVPDLAVYGKTIGGGYAISAVAGSPRSSSLDRPAPPGRRARPVWLLQRHLHGNPLAAAAGLATLREHRPAPAPTTGCAPRRPAGPRLQGLLAEARHPRPGTLGWPDRDRPLHRSAESPTTASAQTADKRADPPSGTTGCWRAACWSTPSCRSVISPAAPYRRRHRHHARRRPRRADGNGRR